MHQCVISEDEWQCRRRTAHLCTFQSRHSSCNPPGAHDSSPDTHGGCQPISTRHPVNSCQIGIQVAVALLTNQPLLHHQRKRVKEHTPPQPNSTHSRQSSKRLRGVAQHTRNKWMAEPYNLFTYLYNLFLCDNHEAKTAAAFSILPPTRRRSQSARSPAHWNIAKSSCMSVICLVPPHLDDSFFFFFAASK